MAAIQAPPSTTPAGNMTGIQILRPDELAYAATITPDPEAFITVQSIAQLTGNLTFNLGETYAVNMTTYIASFHADGSTRTITWGANIAPITATLALAANEGATVTFCYNTNLAKWTASV